MQKALVHEYRPLPYDPSHLLAIWAFCQSLKFKEAVRRIDQALKVTNATLVKVPFDLAYWTNVALERYPNGLPRPHSNDPTQWIFHGHSATSSEPLQVAVARLLGYRWPAEVDPEMQLSDEVRVWGEKSEALLPYADADGIVCIPSVRGEHPADERLRELPVMPTRIRHMRTTSHMVRMAPRLYLAVDHPAAYN